MDVCLVWSACLTGLRALCALCVCVGDGSLRALQSKPRVHAESHRNQGVKSGGSHRSDVPLHAVKGITYYLLGTIAAQKMPSNTSQRVPLKLGHPTSSLRWPCDGYSNCNWALNGPVSWSLLTDISMGNLSWPHVRR